MPILYSIPINLLIVSPLADRKSQFLAEGNSQVSVNENNQLSENESGNSELSENESGNSELSENESGNSELSENESGNSEDNIQTRATSADDSGDDWLQVSLCYCSKMLREGGDNKFEANYQVVNEMMHTITATS